MCRLQLVSRSMRSQPLDSCSVYVPILFALWQISGYTSGRWHNQATACNLLVLEPTLARLASIWPRATLVVDATVRSKNHTRS